MKKTFLVLITTLATIVYTQAQIRITGGIRGGMNVSNWKGETVESLSQLLDATNGVVSQESRIGFHAGGYASFQFGEHFAIEPGVQYSLKGANFQGRFDKISFFNKIPLIDRINAKVSAHVQSHYIEMPLLFKVYPVAGLHIFAGPQASYLVSNKVRLQAGVVGVSLFNTTEDISNVFQKWDFSGVAGVGYKFSNGVNLMAGYDYGFQPLDDNKRFSAFNRTLKFSLGYEF